MYVPESFREADRSSALDLMDAYGFATLISGSAGQPVVSHIPLIIDRSAPGQERILGHVARANEHWKRFDGKEPALAIFHGPHAYVSPAWYSSHPSVPTWNYAVVHVHGVPQVVGSDEAWAILQRLIEKYEESRHEPWKPELPPAFVEENLRAIVGFQMPVARLEAKFKLSQNKDAADRAGALAGLEREESAGSRELAVFARRYFVRKHGG